MINHMRTCGLCYTIKGRKKLTMEMIFFLSMFQIFGLMLFNFDLFNGIHKRLKRKSFNHLLRCFGGPNFKYQAPFIKKTLTFKLHFCSDFGPLRDKLDVYKYRQAEC